MSDKPIELWVVQDQKRLWSSTIDKWEGGAAPQGDTQHLMRVIDQQMEMIKELHDHLMKQNKALFYLINKED